MSTADKKRRYQAALVTIEALQERWAKAFFLPQHLRRPLKVGIRQDIVAAGFDATPAELSSAMRVYCNNRFYMARLRPNVLRIDLNGEPAGFVNSIDAKRADDELMRRRVKAEARRQVARLPVHGSPAPTSEKPRRLSLADLKSAYLARQKAAAQ